MKLNSKIYLSLIAAIVACTQTVDVQTYQEAEDSNAKFPHENNWKRDQNVKKRSAMEYYSPDTEFIMKYIKELKLPTVKDSLDDIITDATVGQWDYRKFLRVLFDREVEQRIEKRKYGRIRKANFPQMKYLQ